MEVTNYLLTGMILQVWMASLMYNSGHNPYQIELWAGAHFERLTCQGWFQGPPLLGVPENKWWITERALCRVKQIFWPKCEQNASQVEHCFVVGVLATLPRNLVWLSVFPQSLWTTTTACHINLWRFHCRKSPVWWSLWIDLILVEI